MSERGKKKKKKPSSSIPNETLSSLSGYLPLSLFYLFKEPGFDGGAHVGRGKAVNRKGGIEVIVSLFLACPSIAHASLFFSSLLFSLCSLSVLRLQFLFSLRPAAL